MIHRLRGYQKPPLRFTIANPGGADNEAYPFVLAFVTQSMSPRESQQRQRSDEETITMLMDYICTFAPNLQKT